MCTGQCSRFIGLALYPLAFISILCNIILFFPGWDVKYAQEGHITEEVKYMGGLVGGGLMVSEGEGQGVPLGGSGLDWDRKMDLTFLAIAAHHDYL